MKSYLFLIAWVDGSESSGFEKTKVHKQEDLYKQFKKVNEHIFAVLIDVYYPPDKIASEQVETLALNAGEAASFHSNYTAYDSTSDMIEITRHVQKVIDRITPECLTRKVRIQL